MGLQSILDSAEIKDETVEKVNAPEQEEAEKPEDKQPEEKEEPEQEKQPEKEEGESPKGNIAAHLRIKNREMERKIAELTGQIESLKKPVIEKKDDVEPNKLDEPEAWAEWKIRRLEEANQELARKIEQKDPDIEIIKQERIWNQAEAEFQSFEREVREKYKDYDEAAGHIARTIYQSFYNTNPGATHDQLVKATKQHILLQAKQLMDDGHDNPAEAFYKLAQTRYRYTPKTEEEKEEKKSPKLEEIENNKKKSVSSLRPGGKATGGTITAASIAKMKVSEIANLDPETIRRLERGE